MAFISYAIGDNSFFQPNLQVGYDCSETQTHSSLKLWLWKQSHSNQVLGQCLVICLNLCSGRPVIPNRSNREDGQRNDIVITALRPWPESLVGAANSEPPLVLLSHHFCWWALSIPMKSPAWCSVGLIAGETDCIIHSHEKVFRTFKDPQRLY